MLVADLAVGSSTDTALSTLSVSIVYYTLLAQLIHSTHERLLLLGGMVLWCSLPNVPMPSAVSPYGPNGPRCLVWLVNTKAEPSCETIQVHLVQGKRQTEIGQQQLARKERVSYLRGPKAYPKHPQQDKTKDLLSKLVGRVTIYLRLAIYL